MQVYKYYFSLDMKASLSQARSNKKDYPKPFDFLIRFFQVFQLEVEESLVTDYLNKFEKQNGENTVAYHSRLLRENIILFKNSAITVSALHSLNDDQEKVGNYLYCFLNVTFSNANSIRMHWADSSSELALKTEQYYLYRFNETSVEDIFSLKDKFLQLYQANDLSFQIESNLIFLLELASKNKLSELAKELKESSKILKKWHFKDHEWIISKITDYDGVFWNDKKILWVNSANENLHYQLWDTYTFKDLKKSAFAEMIDLDEFV